MYSLAHFSYFPVPYLSQSSFCSLGPSNPTHKDQNRQGNSLTKRTQEEIRETWNSAPERLAFETEFYGVLLTGFQAFAAGGAVGRGLGFLVDQFGDSRAGAGLDTIFALGAFGTIDPDPPRRDFLTEPG